MDKKALKLGSRFCLPPNSLGYCGSNTAPEKFKCCVIDGNCEGIEEEFTKFIVFYPYIKTLSSITGLSENSIGVIESYWIGNDLLNMAQAQHYDVLLENFKIQGVPDWLLDELKTTPPKKFIPHHLFQILHVGVGRVSGAVPFNIDSINNCMIRWGKVIKIGEDNATVQLHSLEKTPRGYKIIKLEETHPMDPRFFKNLKIGDIATVHWKQVVKKLTKEETKKLSYWTEKVVKSFETL